MKKCIILMALAALVDFSYGQSVKGRILDGKHAPIELATVRILTADSVFVQGTHTDSLGRYSIQVKEDGNYLLNISCIGYKSSVCEVSLQDDVNMPPIILQQQNVHLDEVTVNASSFIRHDDKMVIYPDKEQKKFSRTGYDLLYRLMIPDVNVDRISQQVSVMGGNVTLYINGNKANEREIKALNPDEIANVEYYDVPTGKYMNDIASINFITKQSHSGGYISLSGEQKIGYLQGDYDMTAKYSNKATSYTLFAGYSIKKHDGLLNNLNETFNFSDQQVVERNSHTIENRVKNNNQYLQLNIANNTEHRTLLSKAFFVHSQSPDNDAVNELSYLKNNARRISQSRTSQNSWKTGMELYGSFQISEKQSLDATVRAEYTRNTYDYGYSENTYSINTHSKEDFCELYGILNYSVQLKRRNSIAVQAFHFQTLSSVDNRGDNTYSKHFQQGESLLFVEYNQKISNKVSLRVGPGFSFIQYKLRHGIRKEKISPRLHFNMMFLPSETQQIRLGCPVGSGYLQLDQLNEVEQQIDSLQVRRGNPNQKIAFQTTPSIAYSGTFGSLNIAANLSCNVINNVLAENFFVENNQLVRSYDNGTKFRMLYSQLAVAYKLTKNLRIKLAGRWQYTKYKSTQEELHWLSGDMQVDYYHKNFSCGIFAQSKSKWIDFNLSHWDSPAKYGVHLNVSYKQWFAECGVVNPFIKNSAQHSSLSRPVYSYNNVIENRLNQSFGYIKLAYTVNFGKKVRTENKDVNAIMNSAILKAN